ncbi:MULTISPECIES: hypothetical protein [Escherichia]|uniref:hypothetical protein n=1 Tax=Escherichia TaxID=561 RepID=UPI0001F07B5F|nr:MULTISPECIES: hypothetical protein [Escherichia]EER2755014.1 hypothetical protein [Escherichia coli]EEZ1115480.1 hypothetical protein [Escherichia coli]EEZ2615759.1 hypothetical protein [Escherichia coli]EFA0787071.1 hypothetical protein [Escherichia coli]EFA1166849.1 hypothetical protein [Escherichia coli]
MPDATLTASYHAYEFDALCRPDKAFTPHPGSCARMSDATLTASYHAYEFDTLCRPDKAFTPHPAVVQYWT